MVDKPAFENGDHVEKISGSSWRGRVVGTYSTDLTPEGYAVESDTEKGSVQIYPAKALRLATPANGEQVERVARALADRFIERGKARVTGASYSSYDEMPGSYRNDFLADARAAIAVMDPTPTQDARVKVLEEAIRTIMARCEALEDEAVEELAKDQTEHAQGFYRGQKGTAKSIRRHLHDLTRTALGNQEERL